MLLQFENWFKRKRLDTKETIVNILEQYYSRKFKNNLISERSYTIYKSIVFIIQNNLANRPIQDITIEDIENLSDHIRSFSNETISKIWNSLNLAFKIAYARNLIEFNIMQDGMLLKPCSNKVSNKIEAFTIQEQENLVDILNTKLQSNQKNEYFIYASLLCLYTGMRIGEVLAICKDSINLENNTLTVMRTLTTNTERKDLFK